MTTETAPVPFQPVGEQARWRYAFELFEEAETGTVVSYDELAEAMGLDPVKDRMTIQNAVQQAIPKLEKECRRTVESVRGAGYRVADPKGHLRRAYKHSTKAVRSLKRGQSAADNVDLNTVDDPAVRKALEAMQGAIAGQIEAHRRVVAKVMRQERAIDLLKEESAQRKIDVEKVNERLARLEKVLGA